MSSTTSASWQGRSRALLLVLAAILVALGCKRSTPLSPVELILATTTSTQDSGLLDYLIPKFESKYNVRVKVIAVGTGEALALGARGDADVLLVHARTAEDEFMAKGDGVLRLDVMHNDFLLVGPDTDPAGVKGKPILDALRVIASTKSPFASRGDKSGTHAKETSLWKAAKLEVEGQAWRMSTGQGMGETARIASEKRAYTLIDRATFLAMKPKLQLVPVSQGDPALFNPYGVIVVNPAKNPRIKRAEAETFSRWLVEPETQNLIGRFGVDKFGERLFTPDALPR